MDLLNMSHDHLLLNHVPTIGTVIGIGLLLLSLVRRNDHLKHASLEVFFVVALLTLPAFLTGMAAETEIIHRDGVNPAAIVAHHDAALQAFALMQLTGAVAWVALWLFRRRSKAPAWVIGATLLLSILTLAMMTPAATLGGEIRHPEIRITEDAPPAATGWLTRAAIQLLVQDNRAVWPVAETLHFLGLCLIFGVLSIVNLRLLGVMKAIPFHAVHRLLPWGMLGFGVNLTTGMLFFIAAPMQYTTNTPFYWKVVFLMAAGLNLLYVTVSAQAWALEAGQDTPIFDKAVGASAIVLWIGVIYWGRMLPFLGNAF